MAPREANPNFADQYLCVDYDGIGLLPNDPSPPMQLESEDEDDIAANIAAATAAAAALNNNNGNSNTGGADQLLLTLDHTAAEVIPAPIDPLSIDPTAVLMDTANAMNPSEIITSGGGDLLFSSLLSTSSAEVTAGSFSFAVTPDHSSTSTNITRTRLVSSNAAPQQQHQNAFHFYTARRNHDTDATVLSDDSPQLMDDSSMDDIDPTAVTAMATTATVSDLGMNPSMVGIGIDTPMNVRRIADHGHFHLSNAAALTITGTGEDVVDHPAAARSNNALISAAPILNFGPNTTLTDLKYFAERGCIVPLLYALKTPKLTALGARLLADYAKNPTRRVAVAGNKRILEFTLRTMQGAIGPPPNNPTTTAATSSTITTPEGGPATGIVSPEAITTSLDPQQIHLEESFRERAVEYAVETIRSLTATEESDIFLMNTPDLMVTLAVVARGGGFMEWKEDHSMVQHHHPQRLYSIPFSSSTPDTTPPRNRSTTSNTPPPRTLLHAASTGAVPLATTMSRRDLQVRPISRSISSASSNSQSSAADLPTATSMEDTSTLPRPNSHITASPTNNSSIISPHSVMDANLTTTDVGRRSNTTRKVSFNSKARLHACIAIMNLSCGKANKIEIAKIPQVLSAMRDVMMEPATSPSTHHASETRLKATTCIKNLSNADANDSALLNSPKLIEALGHVILVSLRDNYLNNNHHNSMSDEQERESSRRRLNLTVTNACLALMNLSIAKANKRRVFRTPGVMEALMAVITKGDGEARVKSCSALSNLAIGYDNKIPMFHYPGFVEAILHVIETDQGEARTKACSIIWSFAAEMRNQVPVRIHGGM